MERQTGGKSRREGTTVTTTVGVAHVRCRAKSVAGLRLSNTRRSYSFVIKVYCRLSPMISTTIVYDLSTSPVRAALRPDHVRSTTLRFLPVLEHRGTHTLACSRSCIAALAPLKSAPPRACETVPDWWCRPCVCMSSRAPPPSRKKSAGCVAQEDCGRRRRQRPTPIVD